MTPTLTTRSRDRCRLGELLASLEARADTRFARYAAQAVSSAETKRALLLMVCGYDVRLNGDVIEVRAKDWVPALLPKAEPMASYLRKQAVLLLPKRLMDPNDERLDAVFSAVR